MRILLLLLLIPLAVQAQVEFAPRRLDDSLAYEYYYPVMDLNEDGSLLCAWSEHSDTSIATEGQQLSADGTPIGNLMFFESDTAVSSYCPTKLSFAHLSNGGKAILVTHG
jgi:hypothetical protein